MWEICIKVLMIYFIIYSMYFLNVLKRNHFILYISEYILFYFVLVIVFCFHSETI